MRSTRFITALTLAMALVAMPALAAAADIAVSGTANGSAVAQAPEPGVAECIPNASPVDAEDFVCDFNDNGTFDLTGLGTGSYAADLRLDWSIYTSAERCAELVGTMTLTNADGTITLNVDNTSRVCETGDPDVHTSTLMATVIAASGDYAGASGTLSGTGTMEAVTAPTSYTTELDVTGTITVPDPTPAPTTEPTVAPTVAPTDDASVAPTAAPSSAAPTPAAGALPDTSSDSGMTATIAAVLAVAFIGSLTAATLRRRRARI